MDEKLYLTNLYDYYKSLLTDKQQNYFEEYYFNDLSLSEISENFCVSRNAIHKQLKEIENKLIEYEQKLKLYSKAIEIKKILVNVDEPTKIKIENLI